MKISEFGEDRFIESLTEQFLVRDESIGIGDDCAVISQQGENVQLVTTDALVEGVHFLTSLISPKDLGYKSLAVNISDIAAMGGEPQYAFFSIALPRDIDCDWLNDLVNGIAQACDQFHVQLLGGDTVGSKRDLFINFTLLGKAQRSKVKYRTTAKPRDLVCVTGFLGDSGAGLKALLAHMPLSPPIEELIKAHVHPYIQLEEGKWLASLDDVHAMMDISDGLDCDLGRLLKASHCGAEIDVEKLPLSKALRDVCSISGWDSTDLCLTGGEDYCLLVTIAPEHFERIAQHFADRFKRPLYPIGSITDKQQCIYKNTRKGSLSLKRYDHFAN